MAEKKDYVDALLEREEKRTQGTLRDVRQMQGSIPIARPGIGSLFTPPVASTSVSYPSKAPKGVNGLEVKGNIGDQRQNEAVKVFGAKAMGGKTPYRNPLVDSNWKSHGEIDSKFGPGDRIV